LWMHHFQDISSHISTTKRPQTMVIAPFDRK
jgi:hypothetical protein